MDKTGHWQNQAPLLASSQRRLVEIHRPFEEGGRDHPLVQRMDPQPEQNWPAVVGIVRCHGNAARGAVEGQPAGWREIEGLSFINNIIHTWSVKKIIEII